MSQTKVNEFIEECANVSSTRLSDRERNLLESFYIWLTRAAEHRNEAEVEQPCPMCDGKGFNKDTGRVVWCEVCYGTGQV